MNAGVTVVTHMIVDDQLKELYTTDSTHVGVDLIRLRTKEGKPFVTSVPVAEDGTWSREDARKRLIKYLTKQGYVLEERGHWSHPDKDRLLPGRLPA